MAVSLRATGTWAELTADGSVAIPATPQAGDRMYLFARWKDFSITATVANWTAVPGTPFADGSVTAGNGTGSVKVGCWYRDWQPGDTDPTIDFSASPTNASVVIMVMQKDVDDEWDTPVARTAAMTNWTSSSQTVSASASVAIRSGSVVMGLIGIRDDTATMTRPASGIDDSTAAITWNGNYVESPATHHSTTTGDDGAADLGYRLVSLGATATLRMTGTISAAETGAALWVIQSTTIVVTPAPASLELATVAPVLSMGVTPASGSLEVTTSTPLLRSSVVPGTALLEVTSFAPLLSASVSPAPATLEASTLAPALSQSVTPATANFTLSTSSPLLASAVMPAIQALTITSSTPVLAEVVTPATMNLVVATFKPSLWPANIFYLDPGGDAVQAAGHFNTIINAGEHISFDPTQQVVGVGSYRFDSDDGTVGPCIGLPGLLGPARRVSCYFRYDSIPDSVITTFEFVEDNSVYSGGGLVDPANTSGDEGEYATATPARNAGQGNKCGPNSPLDIPAGALILSVKIIYERKYDVNTSIGISRVKWVVNGEEGPDHDNTDMPLTDTVVEVDITADRFWEWQDLQSGTFEVIIEARRGDTATAHTQSWDFVKVEVEYHLPARILTLHSSIDTLASSITLSPRATGAVLRFRDGAGASYDGITILAPNTQYRISFAYVLHGLNDLDINIFLNGIPELSIDAAHTANSSELANLQQGWITSPGVNHLCWFDQLYIDDGDDLQDPGNMLSTAKLPVAVNEDNWNATIGTGAVNERPLSEANGKQHTSVTGVRQTYTLQAANVGDVDLTGKTLVGSMFWAWAKRGSGSTEDVYLVANNEQIPRNVQLTTTPSLLRHVVTSSFYPSHAAGIGMVSNNETADTFLFECGAVQAYAGPVQNPALFPLQLLLKDSVTPVVDDLRANPPATYNLIVEVSESGAQLTIDVYVVMYEGQEPQPRHTLHAGPGKSTMPVDNPGIEVSFVILVENSNAYVRLRRRLNE